MRGTGVVADAGAVPRDTGAGARDGSAGGASAVVGLARPVAGASTAAGSSAPQPRAGGASGSAVAGASPARADASAAACASSAGGASTVADAVAAASETSPSAPPPSLVAAWLVGDDIPSSALATLLTTLDPAERRRAARLATAEARRRFVVAHGAVRVIVGAHLGAPPAELRWQSGVHGKPELVGRWTGVHANLSHSGGRCLIAVCADRPVGADIQRILPALDVVAMARRYFPAVEAQRVADASDQAATFACLWSRKEAVTKALGGRLTQVLPLATPEGLVEVAGAEFRVADVAAPAGFRAAVALAGPDPFVVELGEWLP